MKAITILAFLVLVVVGFVFALQDQAFPTSTDGVLNRSLGELYRSVFSEFFLNPWFYVVFGSVLLLEHWWAAKEGQARWTAGLRQDLQWTIISLTALASLLPFYAVFLRYLFDTYLSLLRIQMFAEWPWLGRLLLALLFGDFVFYVSHMVRHKVSLFWFFHAVHHSQKELNFFTEFKIHPIDSLLVYTIAFIPILMVEHSFVTIIAIVWVREWHSHIYHSNIRSNFGFLRYILVTPQSHRIHHSIEPEHQDKNFGLTFSIWDHLFGTQYCGYDEYPDTGITDETFPFEQNHRGPGRALLAQLFYPFRLIVRR